MNEKFVNVWCLNYELKQQRDQHGVENLPPLMQAIIKGWIPRSPVDCLVLSPELKLLGRLAVNELPHRRHRRQEAVVAYDQFLKSSLAGEEPGLERQNDPQRRSNISLQGLPRLTIEMVGPGQFKIDGKGPLTAKEARAEAVRVAGGKKSILVVLKATREAISDDDYSAFRESFHDDGGMLEGFDIKGVGEYRPTK